MFHAFRIALKRVTVLGIPAARLAMGFDGAPWQEVRAGVVATDVNAVRSPIYSSPSLHGVGTGRCVADDTAIVKIVAGVDQNPSAHV